ncbi:MAG TPA: PAS domain S-box protein [Candidatus Acidoferrales bacterium]|nr:PAS domain S-box protein [Candidatus Acidoferrales bacterium]
MRADASGLLDTSVRHIERRQWWLSSSGIIVTILLTVAIISFALPVLSPRADWYFPVDPSLAIHALLGLVLLFDVYVVFQQFQIYRFRQRVREREELFRLIGENAADMIALVDADGKRLYSSPSYKRLLGYSDEELQQTTFYEHIHADDRALVAAAANEARQSGIGRRVEYRVRRKDDSWLVVESTASLVQNHGSAGTKMVIVNRDITERKQLEEQLYLSQKLEAIGRLSGGVAHDFNNLLGVIIGYSEALQKQMGADHPFREAIEEIQNAGNRAAALTQQLLAFSRKQVLEPKVIDLNMVVSEVQKMLRRLIGEDIALKISLNERLGMVKADRGQIDQVILNLAVNARDAMPKGGKLIIETGNAELTESDVNRYRYVIPGQYVMLKVADTGCGMSAELQSHIFEPFFTTKEQGKGTGLGLATVYGVIKQSGGYIWVESEVGKGAAFKVYLPRVEEVRDAVPERTTFGRPQRSRTILLVEDEHSLRKLTRNTLQEAGHTVLEACDASEALDVVKRNESPIDLLLTDVVMPGMSGRALADELATLRPGIKVIYMSGYTDGDVATHGVLQSGISFLRKPFTGDVLIARVDEVLSISVLAGR